MIKVMEYTENGMSLHPTKKSQILKNKITNQKGLIIQSKLNWKGLTIQSKLNCGHKIPAYRMSAQKLF